jgi:hypothetical protein
VDASVVNVDVGVDVDGYFEIADYCDVINAAVVEMDDDVCVVYVCLYDHSLYAYDFFSYFESLSYYYLLDSYYSLSHYYFHY